MELSGLLATDVTWWDALFAMLAVVAGWIASRYARRAVLALMHRLPTVSETLALFAARFAQYALLLLGIGVALAFLGANVQPLLAIVIIVGVVVALVLRGVADNFAAGVLIQMRRPLSVGDEIIVDGPAGAIAGRVTELNSRSVILVSVDGRTVHVPNAKLLQDALVNHSAYGARRSEVQVRASRGDMSLDSLLEALADAAASVSGVHSREPVRVLAVTVSPDRLTARLQFWHHPIHALTVTSAVVLAVAGAMEAASLEATVTADAGVPPLIPPDPL